MPSEFSETDVDATLLWLASENDRISKHNPKGNLYVGKTKDELLAEFLKVPDGRSIRWKMRLSGVSRTGNLVGVKETPIHPSEVIPKDQKGSYHSITVSPAKGEGGLSFAGFSPAEPREWLETAQSGDEVIITGKIKRMQRKNGHKIDAFREGLKIREIMRAHYTWSFALEDGRIGPDR